MRGPRSFTHIAPLCSVFQHAYEVALHSMSLPMSCGSRITKIHDWGRFPSANPKYSMLDLAGIKSPKFHGSDLSPTELCEVVKAASMGSSLIDTIIIDPFILGPRSASLLSNFLRESALLREILIYMRDPNSSPNLAVVNLLLIAASGNPNKCLRTFQTNICGSPEAMKAIASFPLQTFRIGEFCLTSPPLRIPPPIAECLHQAIAGSKTLRHVALSRCEGVVEHLVGAMFRHPSIKEVKLEIDFDRVLVRQVTQLVRQSPKLRSLTLREAQGRHAIDITPLLLILNQSMLEQLSLARFGLSSEHDFTPPKDVFNYSLKELTLEHCHVQRTSLRVFQRCKALKTLSLTFCDVRENLTRPIFDEEGPAALVQRMLFQATFVSHRSIGTGQPDSMLRCQDEGTAKDLLEIVTSNHSLVALEFVGFPRSFLAIKDGIEYYLKLNQSGRRYWGSMSVAAIPMFLEQYTDFEQSRFHSSILFQFLKSTSALLKDVPTKSSG